jgi:aminoglycoside phosphotransferase (APT) family kinase protein
MFEEFMGTKAVSERHQFDVAALDAYLRQHVEGYPEGDLAVVQFKGGQSNPTFKLSKGEGAQQQHYVLRTKPAPAAKLLASAHAIDREYRVMDALNKAGFPAARQYALCTDESVIGRAFYVMEFVDGRVLWDQALPGMTPAERAAIYDEQNRVIALLHSMDYQAIGLGDYGKPGNYFQRQIERWSKQYVASQTEPIEAMDRLIAWLPNNIPPGDDTSIVHGDYRLDNMIFHPTEPRILAVLDWECPPWAIRSPISPTTPWAGTSSRASSAASPGWTCRRWASPRSRNTSPATPSAPARPSAWRISTSIWPSICSAWPASCKAL